MIMEIKTLAELMDPDERVLRFTPFGLSTMGTLRPEDAAEFQQRIIAHCDLHPDVADGTRKSFERLRTLHSYGIFFYEAFTVVDDLAWLLLEQALRERFMQFFNNNVPLVNAKTGEEKPIVASSFDVVDDAFRREGSHVKGSWRLTLSTGEEMDFQGKMWQLQDWARHEHLLDGQRNKRLDAVYVEMRNAVAHPGYHISMPTDSARTISDLAEIINRLWGYPTPGGRLYAAPIDREILVIVWNSDEDPPGIMIMRDWELTSFNEPGNWTCIVVRAVFDDNGIWEFDAQYERTTYPAELLWGPGTLNEALSWITEAKTQADTTAYFDRLFTVRIYEGRVSLPRRPEVALALPHERRTGDWLVIRADYPNDALYHARHIKNGVSCGGSESIVPHLTNKTVTTTPPLPNCAVDEVFSGDWDAMVDFLGSQRYDIEPVTYATVRVRSRFSVDVAQDIEAD